MSTLRCVLLYFADRHTAAIAAVFLLFACIIFHCGNIGAAEVRRRNAAAFTPLPYAETSAVAFVELTTADIELLYGAPLPVITMDATRNETSTFLRPTAATDVAVVQRWHRHFPEGDITLVQVPVAHRTHPLLWHWFRVLEKHCVDCHYLPLMENLAELWTSGVVAPLKKAEDKNTKMLWPFCSRAATVAQASSPASQAAPLRTAAESTRRTQRLDVYLDFAPAAPFLEVPPPRPGEVGCGLFVLWVPPPLQNSTRASLPKTEHPTKEEADKALFLYGDTTTEAQLIKQIGQAAVSVDPPLPFLQTPTATLTERRVLSDKAYRRVTQSLATSYHQHTRALPRFLVVAIVCPRYGPRNFRLDSLPQSPLPWPGAQTALPFLCLRGHEVVEVTPALQTVERIHNEAAGC